MAQKTMFDNGLRAERWNERVPIFLMIGGTAFCMSALVHLVIMSGDLPHPNRVFNETKITQMEQEIRRGVGDKKTELDKYNNLFAVTAVRVFQHLYTISKVCHIWATVVCVVAICAWFSLYCLKQKMSDRSFMDYVLLGTCLCGHFLSTFMTIMWVFGLHLYPNIDDTIKSTKLGIEYTHLPNIPNMVIAAVELTLSLFFAFMIVIWSRQPRDEAEDEEVVKAGPQIKIDENDEVIDATEATNGTRI